MGLLSSRELGILDSCLVLHEFTAVLTDKGWFCSVALLILRAPLQKKKHAAHTEFCGRTQTRDKSMS